MSDTIVNTSVVNDEALALLFHELYEKHAPEFGYETRDETKKFDPKSPNGQLMIKVAHEINATVIKPAGERASAYMLRNYHKALYDALPVGDVDAFDLLQIINTHLENVSHAIRTLESGDIAEAEIVTEESK